MPIRDVLFRKSSGDHLGDMLINFRSPESVFSDTLGNNPCLSLVWEIIPVPKVVRRKIGKVAQ